MHGQHKSRVGLSQVVQLPGATLLRKRSTSAPEPTAPLHSDTICGRRNHVGCRISNVDRGLGTRVAFCIDVLGGPLTLIALGVLLDRSGALS